MPYRRNRKKNNFAFIIFVIICVCTPLAFLAYYFLRPEGPAVDDQIYTEGVIPGGTIEAIISQSVDKPDEPEISHERILLETADAFMPSNRIIWWKKLITITDILPDNVYLDEIKLMAESNLVPLDGDQSLEKPRILRKLIIRGLVDGEKEDSGIEKVKEFQDRLMGDKSEDNGTFMEGFKKRLARLRVSEESRSGRRIWTFELALDEAPGFGGNRETVSPAEELERLKKTLPVSPNGERFFNKLKSDLVKANIGVKGYEKPPGLKTDYFTEIPFRIETVCSFPEFLDLLKQIESEPGPFVGVKEFVLEKSDKKPSLHPASFTIYSFYLEYEEDVAIPEAAEIFPDFPAFEERREMDVKSSAGRADPLLAPWSRLEALAEEYITEIETRGKNMAERAAKDLVRNLEVILPKIENEQKQKDITNRLNKWKADAARKSREERIVNTLHETPETPVEKSLEEWIRANVKGIIWEPEPKKRTALIGDDILGEGDKIPKHPDATILEIKKQAVVIRINGEDKEIFIPQLN